VKIEIKHRWTLAVLFEHDADDNTMRLTVELATKAEVDLSGANLSGADLRSADLRSADLRSANLSGADLRSADLSGADLRSADLRSADLRSADLRGADLSGADLRSADLRSADLRSADLSGADLSGADLSGADLSGADLSGADLRGADLQPIRADFYDVLSHAGREVPALIDAIKNGRVEGSTYTGECACLVGTIANVRGVDYNGIEHDPARPIERFFAGIHEGDTPETNQLSKIALEWAETWLALQRAAFAA
jgi:uncharacterized protein YjbI with pentapeptide repeats